MAGRRPRPAYRFFNNDKTDLAKVLEPHRDSTVQRMRRHDVAIVAQDTTEMELVRMQERASYVMMLSRACSTICFTAVLSDEDWKSVYVIANDQPPPAEPPVLADVIVLIAGLGGYLNRKINGPPGPQAMWIGLQPMRDFGIACITCLDLLKWS